MDEEGKLGRHFKQGKYIEQIYLKWYKKSLTRFYWTSYDVR